MYAPQSVHVSPQQAIIFSFITNQSSSLLLTHPMLRLELVLVE
jgi:hypothetical protein